MSDRNYGGCGDEGNYRSVYNRKYTVYVRYFTFTFSRFHVFHVYSLVSRFPRFTRLYNLPVNLPDILNKPTVTTRFYTQDWHTQVHVR